MNLRLKGAILAQVAKVADVAHVAHVAVSTECTVATDQPDLNEPKGRILRFRPRGGSPLRYWRGTGTGTIGEPGTPPVGDLAKYERTDETDDYRHRMVVNGLALVAVALLIGVGVWIAVTMADLRKKQDCALQGRRNCTPIEVTTPGRW
jgi:hypothetical protein